MTDDPTINRVKIERKNGDPVFETSSVVTKYVVKISGDVAVERIDDGPEVET